RVFDEVVEIFLELVQAGLASERLVVAKEGEDHVGPRVGRLEAIVADAVPGDELARLRHGCRAGQPLIAGAEVHGAQPAITIGRTRITRYLVTRITEVADH